MSEKRSGGSTSAAWARSQAVTPAASIPSGTDVVPSGTGTSVMDRTVTGPVPASPYGAGVLRLARRPGREVGPVLGADDPLRRPPGRVARPPAGEERPAEQEPGQRADVGQEDHDEEPEALGQVPGQAVVGGDDVEDAVDPQRQEQERNQALFEQEHARRPPSCGLPRAVG